MYDVRFGIEIEFTGVTRQSLVELLEIFFQSEAISFDNKKVTPPYVYYKIKDEQNRYWTVFRDRSIRSEISIQNLPSNLDILTAITNEFGNFIIDVDEFKVELTSPVLTSSDIPTLIEIVNRIKLIGGIVNDTTGIHIHIDAPKTVEETLHFINRFYLEQEQLIVSFSIHENRIEKYCSFISEDLLLELHSHQHLFNYASPRDIAVIVKNFYQQKNTDRENPEKYTALNIASILERETLELRFFNSTLDSSEIIRIIDWVFMFCRPETLVEAAV